jgi:hypothetical protein
MSESQKINDKIKELMNKENLDPAELEAEIQKINEAILDALEQYIKNRFGPDAKIERTEGGIPVLEAGRSVPQQAAAPA